MDDMRLLGMLVMLPGFAIGLQEIRNLYRGAMSQDWPTVIGKVVSTDIHPGTYRGGDSAVDVVYEYELQGHTYQSRRLDFGGQYTGGHGALERGYLRFRPGKAVEVYYDPDDPTRAVLEPGVTVGMYVRLLLGLALVLLGATIG